MKTKYSENREVFREVFKYSLLWNGGD